MPLRGREADEGRWRSWTPSGGRMRSARFDAVAALPPVFELKTLRPPVLTRTGICPAA